MNRLVFAVPDVLTRTMRESLGFESFGGFFGSPLDASEDRDGLHPLFREAGRLHLCPKLGGYKGDAYDAPTEFRHLRALFPRRTDR